MEVIRRVHLKVLGVLLEDFKQIRLFTPNHKLNKLYIILITIYNK